MRSLLHDKGISTQRDVGKENFNWIKKLIKDRRKRASKPLKFVLVNMGIPADFGAEKFLQKVIHLSLTSPENGGISARLRKRGSHF